MHRRSPSRLTHAAASASILVSALVSACRSSPAPHEAPSSVENEPAAAAKPAEAEPAPPAWTSNARVVSNGGDWVLHVVPAPNELPDNEPFELRVWIARTEAPNELASGVALSVDASMPEHGHGMNRTPRISRGADGEFLVEGMLFHMTGHWELYFDVTAGALTERAQADVVLE